MWGQTWIVTSVLGALLLAGCLGSGSKATGGNEAPDAVLAVDRGSGEVGDAFVFNGTASNDPDGNLTLLRLDLGDGTVREFSSADDARIEHRYDAPGEYKVALVVLDDGGTEGDAIAATAKLAVAVNQRTPYQAQVLIAGSGITNGTRTHTTDAMTQDGADTLELNGTMDSLLVAGTSEIRIRVLDAEGKELANETYMVPSGQTVPLNVAVDVETTGKHVVEAYAVTGGARLTGELIVWYDDGFDDGPQTTI